MADRAQDFIKVRFSFSARVMALILALRTLPR